MRVLGLFELHCATTKTVHIACKPETPPLVSLDGLIQAYALDLNFNAQPAGKAPADLPLL